MKTIAVKQRPDEEVPTEVLAQEIVALSAGIKKLRAGRLNDRALHLLIQNAAPSIAGRYKTAPLSLKTINAVLEGIEGLEAAYLKKKPEAKKS